jgi:hypothetical protein
MRKEWECEVAPNENFSDVRASFLQGISNIFEKKRLHG